MIAGGRHRPEDCTARQKVAIIVPYRDRDINLRIFLNHMHAFLMKQQLDYRIYVVDLDKKIPFNKGFLLNVGFMEATEDNEYDCFILHDVDFIPENDHNLYTCAVDQPRHLSVAMNKWKYKLPYPKYFGGVVAMTMEQFEAINGFSNEYFRWGGEDDDSYNRVAHSHMTIYRAMGDVGRYTMLPHKQAVKNPKMYSLMKTGIKRMKRDGLNSLKYKVLQRSDRKLFTYIMTTLDRTNR
ncbi:beta-1,4-galactosyltransferase 3-like [Saccostrea echinata]|uniref:beta-1,4-galactosyltransferase 3-like n=1 Tax=Saccostrea echinata TaxID=191078 RepID=UPI002A817CB6|nr:beta-1,4-galactosyltransferase 3-like [Saccostrea echinata]